ncbi:MAG: sigma-54-dependent Fis family transcriptional regulator [Planctomycetales bacterium]|nr:sigma-54-dependent Fis family transcriptional regulator [Planctomycetales bacterium]
MSRLLVIDDEPAICWGLKRLGEDLGHEVIACASAEEGLVAATNASPDVIVLDVRLPGLSGLEAIDKLRDAAPQAPVLLITAYGDLATAVEAVRKDAFEFVVKPFDLEPMRRALQRALTHRESLAAGEQAVSAAPTAAALDLDSMIGASPAMREAFRQIALAADAPTSVLLVGESGVGKELAARAIHNYSRRSDGPFVAVNIASLNPALAESELFGHVRGAFTGADAERAGLLAQADGGTLFLDEVADIPLPTQVKLLRALERGEVLPVGGNSTVTSDFRVVAATHKDLLALVQRGEFRHDLYFRLSAMQIRLPPLRQRPDDIILLAEQFLAQFSARAGRPLSLSQEARDELAARPWYGNVRELRNALEHAAAQVRQGEISSDHLPTSLPQSALPADLHGEADNPAAQLAAAVRRWVDARLNDPAAAGQIYDEFLAAAEPELIAEALAREPHLQDAARLLGVHRTTLRRKIDQHGVES